MAEKGRKAAKDMMNSMPSVSNKAFLQCEAAGLPTHVSPRLVRIREIATIDRDEILEQSAKANNGKRDYAYAFGVLTEIMKQVAWLAQTVEETNFD